MSYLSDDLENKLLDHTLKATAYTPPTSVIFSFFTADPGESGATGEVSSSGTGYARVTVANNTTNFPQCSVSGTPTKTNGSVIQFPTPTASWGTVTHWAAYHQDGTTMLAHGPLVTPQSYSIGDTPKLAIGGFSLQFSNGTDGGPTSYLQRKLLDLVFGAVSFSSPSTVYVELGTALSGDLLTAWTDANYLRKAVPFGSASGGVSSNTFSSAIQFTTGAAEDASLTHFSIMDASSGGTALVVAALGTSLGVKAADTVAITAAGQINVTLQ